MQHRRHFSGVEYRIGQMITVPNLDWTGGTLNNLKLSGLSPGLVSNMLGSGKMSSQASFLEFRDSDSAGSSLRLLARAQFYHHVGGLDCHVSTLGYPGIFCLLTRCCSSNLCSCPEEQEHSRIAEAAMIAASVTNSRSVSLTPQQAHRQRHDEKHNEDEEQDLRNRCGGAGDSAEA
jgi:hypothetical protein